MYMQLSGYIKYSMPYFLKGQFKVIRDQIKKHCCMDMKLGGNSKLLIPECLKVISRSSEVTIQYNTQLYNNPAI